MFKIKNVFCEITNNKDRTVNLIISNNFISYNNEKLDEMVKEVVDLYIPEWLENKTNKKLNKNNIGYLGNNFTIIIYSLWEWDKLISITKNKNLLINAKNFIPIISPWEKYKWKRLNSKSNKNFNKYIDNLLKLEKNKLIIIINYQS